MPMPEGPNVLVSRQSVLLATGVGVGLLTLVYVLGVQVGKQSAALQAGNQGDGGELKSLPASLADQLRAFEQEAAQLQKARLEPVREEPKAEPEPAAPKVDAKKESPKPEPAAPSKKEASKGDAKKEPPKALPPGERWTQQLVTTTDPLEAKRVAARAREAGFETFELKNGDTIRVRIKGAMAKTDADAAGARLKEKGLKPFAVKAE